MTVPSDCSQLGCEVEVGAIDLELKRLWEADEARTNASLINFVVYSEKASALSENTDIVREITREHACRVILVGVDRSQPEASMRAWVTAHCNLSNGNKTVCCEQLAFHLAGRVSGRLSNTVFAHLNSDLPLIFWWQGNLTERFNDRLYTLIDRLVIDSSDWDKPRSQFELIAPAMLENNLVVQDLSWTRTYHVRLAIASVFDDPIAQAAIASVKKLRIVTSEKGEVAGLQLLAWFAEQCAWLPAQQLIDGDSCAGGYQFENSHNGPIDVSVQVEAESADIGLVEIEAGDVRISVRRLAGEQSLHIKLMDGDYVIENSAPADATDEVGLVRDQLSRGGKNSLFRKVFPRFLTLLKD